LLSSLNTCLLPPTGNCATTPYPPMLNFWALLSARPLLLAWDWGRLARRGQWRGLRVQREDATIKRSRGTLVLWVDATAGASASGPDGTTAADADTCRAIGGRPLRWTRPVIPRLTPANDFAPSPDSETWTCWPATPPRTLTAIRAGRMAIALSNNLHDCQELMFRRRVASPASRISTASPIWSRRATTTELKLGRSHADDEGARLHPPEIPDAIRPMAYLGKRCVAVTSDRSHARGQRKWLPDPISTAPPCADEQGTAPPPHFNGDPAWPIAIRWIASTPFPSWELGIHPSERGRKAAEAKANTNQPTSAAPWCGGDSVTAGFCRPTSSSRRSCRWQLRRNFEAQRWGRALR